MMNEIGILTIILAAIGGFYLFVPHVTHISSGFSFGLQHSVHQAMGAIILVLAYLNHIGKLN